MRSGPGTVCAEGTETRAGLGGTSAGLCGLLLLPSDCVIN